MKKLALFSLIVSAAAVVVSPLALADNKNIDSYESIEKEYQKAMEQKSQARERVDHDNVDYSSERRNLDNPDRIKKEYQYDTKRREDAKRNAVPSEDSNPNYSEDRKNIDSQGNIRKEYERMKRGDNKPQE